MITATAEKMYVTREKPGQLPGFFFQQPVPDGYTMRMLHIHLNGEAREVGTETTIDRLLDSAGFGGRRVAVEINREIVPRSAHARHVLNEGDRVEIVHALGGG